MLVIAPDIKWSWIDNDDGGNVAQNAFIGAHSEEGRHVYVVLAKAYIPGNHEEGKYVAEYALSWSRMYSNTWQYLVVSGNVSGMFSMFGFVMRMLKKKMYHILILIMNGRNRLMYVCECIILTIMICIWPLTAIYWIQDHITCATS